MSRVVYYKDNRLTVITGNDHILGLFIQVYDNKVETPDGEGIVLDWSEGFKYSINLTGIPNNDDPTIIVNQYVEKNVDNPKVKNPLVKLIPTFLN